MNRKDATKQKLLEATLAMISEKGYLGATTREISRKAGVTELTLFRHFGTKEQLFEELLKSYTFLPKLKELIPEVEQMPYEEALNCIGVRFLSTLKERKAMLKILLTEIHLYPDRIRHMYTAMTDEVRMTLAAYFESLGRRGVMRNVSPDIAARTFLGVLFNHFRSEEIMKRNGMTKPKMEQSVREFVDIFVNGTMR